MSGVVGCSVEASVPILGFAHVSAGMEYVFIPFTVLELTDTEGTPYSRTYHESNLGGLALRLGIVLQL